MKIFNSPNMFKVICDVRELLNRSGDRENARALNLDGKLSWLVHRINQTASDLETASAVRCAACAAFAWLESMHVVETDIAIRIASERTRQLELFLSGKLGFRVDSRIVCPLRKFRVLVEEAGEVAEAIDSLEMSPRSRQRRNHLIDELVQVAAVCVAWLESFEVAK